MIAILSVIVSTTLLVLQTTSLSALRPGTDVSTNDLQIDYEVATLRYRLVMNTNFEFINSIYVLCFRERPVFFDTNSPTTCSLSNSNGIYQCFQFDGSGTSQVYTYFQLSSDKTTVSNIDTYTPNAVLSGPNYGSQYFSLDGTISTGSITYLTNTPSVYELISNKERVFTDSSVYKLNYVTTGPAAISASSNSLIMPFNFECAVYNSQIATLVFYGGVKRIQTSIMIYSVITYHLDLSSSFAAWQGFTFSKSHAFRDMMAFILNQGTLYDLYSLMATSPYDDTSTNVNGVNDWVLIESTGQLTKQNITWLYYTSFYRYYETTSSGDQTILQKMENKHCLVSYIETGTLNSFSALPTDSNYKHNMMYCYYPNVGLGGKFIRFGLALLLIGLILI